ncbi:monocarboxylate transporter 12 [Gouania willdenowi]|uniref:Monocarboxylate transporter 12-like n=1 Tax=Gouania willdenowi TaxID=441366 RepID=A0A8C5GDD4_GOUWI|nr:monocarboxylate transporter 12-like [Gouania willdenowi]XP_028305911.1 monocarboxylate transporter 12-like [Gouania willdenowi]XP_028305912.1 monocarboxylate transporter 12-like [Gouania willdenowi]XP_028305913.1 monocarboxylate transporter 12-like [Gouania willdenowi]XP_028305914.1 monocarboxylate transporter 12-like [Gouania willdenowi]XP_028305915.1 monocarboxylate transporter 12-like [Gouania willdenowi]
MNSPVKPENRRVSVVPVAAPDSGYAWFILISCFFVFGLTFGVIKAFGVFYVEIHKHFETTAAGTSWITSIAVATLHVVAPVSSALSARYSPRSVVIWGGLICSIGVGCGSFARSLVELYLTVGFLNGFGYALTWTPTVTMLAVYFQKRRPLANALASSGECILTFILTPLFQLLIDSFSWRGALLILAGLQLNLCVCGMLLRPLETTTDVPISQVKEEEMRLWLQVASKEDVNEVQQRCDEAKGLKISEANCQWTSQEDTVNKPNVQTDSHPQTKMGKIRTQILRYADFTLITNARFLVYSMFGVFAALGFFAPGLFLVPYARSKGIAEYQAAALMSISAVLDLFGRVFFGWVANLRVVETVQQLTASVTLLGTTLLLCPLASSFPELAAFSAAYGLVYGATVAIHITVLGEVVGVQRLGSALGFFMLIRSSGGLLGPPIAGFFIDQMSDYGTGFLMAGVALIVSALFLLLLHQMNRRSQKSELKEIQDMT